MIIQAPYPLLQSSLVMPSPKIGNQKNLASTVQTMRMMDGSLHTYVKGKRGRKVWQWDMVVTKDKARETIQFVKVYSGGVVRVTDHEGVAHIGYVTINPLELQGDGRASGYPSGEVYRLTISLEEKI